MRLDEALLVALRALGVNRLRTALTMLGIVIGVAAVIAMASIGEGAQQRVARQITSLGTNLVLVSPRRPRPDELVGLRGRSEGLVIEDADAIAAQVPGVVRVVPSITVDGPVTRLSRSVSGGVEGTTPDYPAVRNFRVARGRFLTQADLEERRQVAVLGVDAAADLFPPGVDPVGQEIRIRDERFLVVGVMEPKGQIFFTNFDEKIFVPLTTASRRLTGTDRLSAIQVEAASPAAVPATRDAVDALLRRRHQGIPDYRIRSQDEFLRTLRQTIATFRALLGGIAAISLLVGGVGIMNIMLVSVTERTREIGIRKAVGATRGDILRQFLIEAATVSLVGGLVGIAGGVWLGEAAARFVSQGIEEGGWEAVVTGWSVVLAVGAAVAVGLVFGLYPAARAARLDPARALRYE
ncbi:MAG TPA: ABC transporter permease [Thermodesulfobacteriota bacterium]|nr:ABC transporter permease [Thermodesulfobacteriota bacterium]